MDSKQSPILIWFRQDLRLSDLPALSAAVRSGRPIIPVFIRDSLVDGLGAAPKWRLGLGLAALAQHLERKGSKLVLRSGPALDALKALISETGAQEVYWSRAYDPDAIARDTGIKSALAELGLTAKSFAGHLLFEPWTVATKTGAPFRVFTPMWRAVAQRDVPSPDPAPERLAAPTHWPASEHLDDWGLGHAMRRGAGIVGQHVQAGETAAEARLDAFMERLDAYPAQRDALADDTTSHLSEYLALGEIGPRTVWHRVKGAALIGSTGADAFLRQLVWREFAYHLMYHTPHLLTRNWRQEWDGFPWNEDIETPEVRAWMTARTGIPVVDAGLREMYVTGRMHNRARMIVASYLTKHLMTHWKIGMDWFADGLVDWDAASNAMGWQWVAGSGPDAAPFFRIFNPQTQAEKFDPTGAYVRRWVAEGQSDPPETALAYFEAIPRSWNLSPNDAYPRPVVDLKVGRARALAAYEGRKDQ
ncbi:deoxyribodipyrimidine photo-lyase [Ruegeria intermedia]|uniref:Deoxyribodipyrimidine photo-lyase n=1 Tax=Ruegeria intermedia TaxID=996115 RepID=A0A1M5BLI1_9RHOB|nr:deoxyribodipyrimidine photo-lyase [Ruegeria intermedia]SHF43296.1 deoxyribodipyrimidine photo-lyase [Ruegeria intermedia]